MSSRLIHHRQQSLQFLPIGLLSSARADQEETTGKPETLAVTLPSSLPAKVLKLHSEERVLAVERELRRVACLKALQSVRTTAIQRAHLLKSKKANARGIVKVTRAEGAIARLTARIAQYQAQYTRSRKALLNVGPSPADRQTFRELKSSDLDGLSKLLLGKTQLGDGFVTMPWYWRVQLPEDELEADEVSISKPELRREYEESKYSVFSHPVLVYMVEEYHRHTGGVV